MAFRDREAKTKRSWAKIQILRVDVINRLKKIQLFKTGVFPLMY
jgi:hypothetical protein